MSAYEVLAKYYDNLMGDFDYKGYVAFLNEKLVGCGVDLCCGSGKITIELSKQGRKMTGVDLSAEMLNMAVVNARKQGQQIAWINSDICKFEPFGKVDFFTCVCDGVNYVAQNKLQKLFSNIATHTKKDGYFIFDISSHFKLENILGDNVFCEDRDDITYIWSNKFDKKANQLHMDLSFFERANGDNYTRRDELHTQYAHTQQELTVLLESEWDIQTLDGETFGQPQDNSKRLLFVCKRK
ncbi:MAG: class I SAM-dependent methyltransferase [Clostridia bacterium]